MEKLDKNKSGTGNRGGSKRVGKRWQRTKFRLSRERDREGIKKLVQRIELSKKDRRKGVGNLYFGI